MKIYKRTFRIFALTMLMLSPAIVLTAKPHTVLPLPVGDKMNIHWSGWNNYPNTNIFYRIEVLTSESTNSTVAVEVLNNYKKEISFAVALNDDGLETVYTPIKSLKKQRSTVINYPRPKNSNQFFAFFNNVEIN